MLRSSALFVLTALLSTQAMAQSRFRLPWEKQEVGPRLKLSWVCQPENRGELPRQREMPVSMNGNSFLLHDSVFRLANVLNFLGRGHMEGDALGSCVRSFFENAPAQLNQYKRRHCQGSVDPVCDLSSDELLQNLKSHIRASRFFRKYAQDLKGAENFLGQIPQRPVIVTPRPQVRPQVRPVPQRNQDKDFGFSLSSATTSNSRVTVSSRTLESGATFVKIEILKDGKFVFTEVVEVENGAIHFRTTLPRGPGQYILRVGVSTDPDNVKWSAYKMLGSFTVTNMDPREGANELLPNSYIESENPEIVALAHQLTQGLTSDLEKTKAIHKWIAKNVKYDYEGLNQRNSANTVRYNSLKVLHDRAAICAGYAALTAAMNRAVGIRTKYIIGEAFHQGQLVGSHAWNETYVNGRWILQDTTWSHGSYDHMKYFDPQPGTGTEHRKKDEL